MSHEVETKPDEIFEEQHDRFDKAIIVAIVLTALLAATVGLGQMRALKRHDAAIARSDRSSALASQVSFTWNSIAQLQIDRFRLAQDAQIRAEQATADARFRVGPPLATSNEARQWGILAQKLTATSAGLTSGSGGFAGAGGMIAESEQLISASAPELTAAVQAAAPSCGPRAVIPVPATVPAQVTQSGPDGPARDPTFPTRYLADTRRFAYQLEAQGLLASENAEDEEKQFTRLGVSLTMLATAVFLFGFALSPYGRVHRHLYCAGAALLVTGSAVWGTYALLDNPATPPAGGAAAYAAGRVAYDKGDHADIVFARTLFTCAIKQDPRFGPAYTARAAADNSITDPADPTDASNTELVGTAYMKQARSDLNRAKALGAEDPTLPIIEGTDVFEAGLRTGSRARMEDGLAREEEALRLLAGTTDASTLVSLVTHPATAAAKDRSAGLLGDTSVVAFNIAEAELALGNVDASRRAYRSAIALSNAQDEHTGGSAAGYVSAALTDLNDLQQHVKASLQSEIRFEKGYLASQFDLGSATGSGDGRGMTLGRLTVMPALAQFAIPRLGNADQFSVAAQWYFRPHVSDPWSAFNYMNGQMLLQPSGHGYVASAAFYPSFSLNHLCLPRGGYKVEVFVHGHLAASAESTVGVIRTYPAPLEHMGVTLCVPSPGSSGAWSEVRPNAVGDSPARMVGIVDGYVSHDRRAGIVAFDVSAESDRQRCGTGLNRRFIASVVRQFASSLPPHLAPAPNSRFPFLGTGRFPFLGGAENTYAAIYTYPGGWLAASAAATAQHRVIVGVVFGPGAFFQAESDPASGSPADSPEVPPAASLLGSISSSEGPAYPDSCA